MIQHHIAPRDWVGQTAVIVASGPSTESVNLNCVFKHRVVAVAHGYRAVPDAEVLVVGGQAFYQHNDLSDFRGGLIVAAQALTRKPNDSRLVWMRRAGPHGLTDDRGSLCGSESSVMLAINYVVHRGVSRIVLLGCDGRPAPDGKRRFGAAGRDSSNALERYRVQERAMATQLEPLRERGISIVNCSPRTALTIYPTAKIEDVT